MSDQSGLLSGLNEEVVLSSAGPPAEPQTPGTPQESNSIEDNKTFEEEDDEEEDEDVEEEEEEDEEVAVSAHLEPSTLPWPGDVDKRPQTDGDDGIWSELEERDTGTSGGSQDLSEVQSQAESDRKSKAKWRESMPEGERWRDDVIEVQRDDKGDGSLADDEEEEEEEGESNWMSEKAALVFTPQVTIVRPSSKELPEESRHFVEKDIEKDPLMEPESAGQFYPDWTEQEDKYCEYDTQIYLFLLLYLYK